MSATHNSEQSRVALCVNDACASLSISRTTLYEEIASGRLRAVKCGKRTLIPADGIKAWLAGLPAKAA